jgi:hypothetical protein
MLMVVLPLLLSLSACTPGGDSGQLTPQDTPSTQARQQAMMSLVELYRQAVQAEDIDRVQALLALDAGAGLEDTAAFRQHLTATFRTRTVTALAIPPSTTDVAADLSRVTFLEVESVLDPTILRQSSRVYRTTLTLTQTTVGKRVTFRIAAARRVGPLVEIHTPGQVQAGALTRVAVQGSADAFPVARAEVQLAAGPVQALRAVDGGFHGVFVAASQAVTLAVQLRSTTGEELVVQHPYQVRQAGDGVVERLGGTDHTRVLAVAVAADGTV